MRLGKIKKLNLSYSIGDTVTIDPDYVYQSYTQFVKRHRKYAARFQYKQAPEPNEVMTVIGIHRHVMEDRFDACKYVVVVADKFKRIFLVGELGVKKKIAETLC